MEKSRLFRLFYHLRQACANCIIILPSVGAQAAGAILDAVLRICKAAAALIPQGIQGAEAKQAIEILRVCAFMARKIFAFPILEKFIVFHNFLRYT